MTVELNEVSRQTLQSAIHAFISECSEEDLSNMTRLLPDRAPSAEPDEVDRKFAEQDQYADRLLSTTSHDTAGSDSDDMRVLAQYIPLRLTYEERPLLRLIESALQVSDYTDRVDIKFEGNHARKVSMQVRHMCALLSGLVTAQDFHAGQSLLKSREYLTHADFFRKVFEIGRRYKLLNPERMRDSYGKLVYFLQDTVRPDIQELLEFSCISSVDSVFTRLSKDPNGLALLSDELLPTATREITTAGKSRAQIDKDALRKRTAIKVLTQKYATVKQSRKRSSVFSRLLFFSDPEPIADTSTSFLTEEDVEQCLYSICDYNTFLRFNREPCDKMIYYLQKYFDESCISLAINEGEEGSRLSHSHARQYQFVHQSLSLWREVLHDMFRLWNFAEQDLLDESTPYKLEQTGQGLQRVQNSPRVAQAMTRIIARVQKALGGWVGSSIVHLGDKNVPNALVFIDKYIQVPRILGPLVLTLEKIEKFYSEEGQSAMRAVVDSFGGVEALKVDILRDFFRHAFDGSGGDNFFEAGSCIDGRLTSAWNWCSKIEQKPYFPVFLLTGFTGFDGKEGW